METLELFQKLYTQPENMSENPNLSKQFYPIKQYNFTLKCHRSDGLILQIHNTNINGNQRRSFRFTKLNFHPALDQLCAADQSGNVFVVDFSRRKYSILANTVSTTFVAFVPMKRNLLLMGFTTRMICVVDGNSGEIVTELEGHKNFPKTFSFSSEQYFLTASDTEAIVWDVCTYSKMHQLSLTETFKIKFISFIPNSNNIVCCFDNDVMHIWDYKTFEQLHSILPATWKGGDLKSFSFTKNGRGLVLGGRSDSLVVFTTDNWTLDRIIQLPNSIAGVRQIQFIPELFDGGANKILGIVCSKCTFHVYDIENNCLVNQKINPPTGIVDFESSWNGQYTACISQTGEINIYSTRKFLVETCPKVKATLKPVPKTQKKLLKTKECEECFCAKRLSPILRRYGEYPENYRILIWKMLLKTPGNQKAFQSLVDRGYNPAFRKLNEIYPLENKLSLINLQRTLSLLASWCPLFGQTKSLPLFVYPFVKILHNDPMLCFEVIASVILNFCQHWYEYFPFPPMNILSIVENIFATCDPVLLRHLNTNCVTSELFAWTLLESAFSEVLSQNEWLKLWDHIITNEPSFLLVAVVAYNITNRVTLLSCKSMQEFHHFYHNQNSIDMKKFLAKTYAIIAKLNAELHPRQYLKDFAPIPAGDAYPVFVNYPKTAIDYQAKELAELHKEEEKLREQEAEVAEMRATQLSKYKEQIKALEHDARLKSIDEIYKKTLVDEENRLYARRKSVAALNAALQKNEATIFENNYSRILLKNHAEKAQALEMALDEITRRRNLESGEISEFKNALKEYANKLVCESNQLEGVLRLSGRITIPPVDHSLLLKQHENLSQEMKKIKSKSRKYSENIALITRVAAVDNMLQDVEVALASEMARRQEHLLSNEDNIKTWKLQKIVEQLENYVKDLLEKLAASRLHEADLCHNILTESLHKRVPLNLPQSSSTDSANEILPGRHGRPCSPVTPNGPDDFASLNRPTNPPKKNNFCI